MRAVPIADEALARQVLHWLAVGGLILGSAQLVVYASMLSAWGLPPSMATMPRIVGVLYRVSAAVAVVAPAMLVAGSAGLAWNKPWARARLISYAFLQIAGALASQAVSLAFAFESSQNPTWTGAQRATAVLSGLESMLLHSLFPAAILLCLVRAGLLRTAAPASSSFEVLPRAEPPSPPAGA